MEPLIVALSGVYIAFGTFGILSNSFLLFVILQDRKIRSTVSFMLIIALALGDLVFSVGFNHIGIVRILSMHQLAFCNISEISCTVTMLPMSIGASMQQYLIFSIATERAFMIFTPLFYCRQSRSIAQILITVSLTWTFCNAAGNFVGRSSTTMVPVCAGFVFSMTETFRQYLAVGLQWLPFSATVTLYISTIIHVRLKLKSSMTGRTLQRTTSKRKLMSGRGSNAKPAWEEEVSKCQMTLLVLYSLTCGTAFVVQLISQHLTMSMLTQIALIQVLSILQGTTCCSNVFVYGCRIKEVRLAMYRYLPGCVKGRKNNEYVNVKASEGNNSNLSQRPALLNST